MRVPQYLFVAAGGGGDVIAAAMIASAMRIRPQDAVLATWAWDRLLLDPRPGPRSPRDFHGLGMYCGRPIEVLETTEPPTGVQSTLPRLKSDLGHRLVLLEPDYGVRGLTNQLESLRESLSGDRRVLLVDVGGDVLAQGDEPGLRSPLADAVTLAACAQLGDNVDVIVAGPGLDGELTPGEVLDYLRTADAHELLTLTEADTTPAMSTLLWHPSEATALLVAAARGLDGVAEIRDAGCQVALTPGGRVAWALPAPVAAKQSLATRLHDTTTFAEAEQAMRQAIGWTELDYERRKVARLSSLRSEEHELPDLESSLESFEAAAVERGTDFVTYRRLMEALGVVPDIRELRARLLTLKPDRSTPPLWRVH